jgi:hypothetical protein
MKRTLLTIGFAAAALILLVSSNAHAGWIKNGALVSGAWNTQREPQICTDGAGGAIIVWEDFRTSYYDIYVQRLDPNGNPMWTTDGVAICTATGNQDEPRIVADGVGGAIIVWEDPRGLDKDVYAQRVDAGGGVLWIPDGVPVCTDTLAQVSPALVSDGAEGAVITWQDFRNNAHDDIFAQRIDMMGNPMWTMDGVPVCTNDGDQEDPVLTPNGFGGAIVAWSDGRVGTFDVYAQHIDDAGDPVWSFDGEPVCTVVNDEDKVMIVSDGSGGAVISWRDFRTGVPLDYDIYAQRIDVSGTPLWAINGVAICTASKQQFNNNMLADGQGGAFIVWQDNRVPSGYDIYIQYVKGSGLVQWTANGVPVSTPTGDQNFPTIASDGAGGVIITWSDYRTSTFDIYAQRVDALGTPQWTANGEEICTAGYGQFQPQIVAGGAGGAIITWFDYRSGSIEDVYAQRIGKNGKWGNPAPTITMVLDVPGDQGGLVDLTWLASRLDPWPEQQITTYTIWRSIAPVVAATMIESGSARALDGPRAATVSAKTTIRVERAAGETFYWELIDSHDAYYLEAYSKAVPTLFDSTAASPDPHFFQVIAHTSDPLVYWISNVGAGFSFDNVAPSPPLTLTAQRTNGDVDLEWSPSAENAEDLLHYAVYRSESSGFPPDPAYFLTDAPDTLLTDTTADPAKQYYYLVVAVDVHFNESDPSNEAMVGGATAVDERVPAVTALTVVPNSPNPFGVGTEIRFGLPVASEVTLEVYDIAGRRVFAKRTESLPAGWRSLQFDGRDVRGKLLPSGVYFYRLSAGGVTQTRKMVLLR